MKNISKKVIKNSKNLICRFNDDDILALSSQLAYSLLLSFFPFLIFVMTVIGFSPLKSQDVLASLVKIVPKETYQLIKNTIKEVVDYQNIHLLSFSLIIAVWTSSSGFNAVIKAINKAYDVKERRGFLKVQLIAILCTLVLAIIILFTFIMLIFGEVNGKILAQKLGLSKQFKYIWNILRYTIMFISMTFTFATLYKFTPNMKLKWRQVLSGAIFSSIGWIVSSVGFSFYVDNFGNYSRFYGSIGAVIVLMLWLFISSIVVLLGGEINAVIIYDRVK